MKRLRRVLDASEQAKMGSLEQSISTLRDEMGVLAQRASSRVGQIENNNGALIGEMQGLRSEFIGEIRGLRGEMQSLRGEFTGEIKGLRGQMTGIQGEFTGLKQTVEGMGARVAGVDSMIGTFRWQLSVLIALVAIVAAILLAKL